MKAAQVTDATINDIGIIWPQFRVGRLDFWPEFGDALPSLNPRNPNISSVTENAERGQQPQNDRNHDDDVEDFLNLPIHWKVSIDQPEQHPDHD
jgi:hypothetical protein